MFISHFQKWSEQLERQQENRRLKQHLLREFKLGLCDNLGGGIGWEVEGRFKREGTYVYLWRVHVDVWQKRAQDCKAIYLSIKNK